MVGVKTGHGTRPITPRGGTLDLPLLWPTALWDRGGIGKVGGEERKGDKRREREWGRWDE